MRVKAKDKALAKMNLPLYYMKDEHTDHTWVLEGNYQIHSKWWVGSSFGTSRETSSLTAVTEDMTPIQKVYGASFVYRDKLWVFTSPQFGVAHFEKGGVTTLFSARF